MKIASLGLLLATALSGQQPTPSPQIALDGERPYVEIIFTRLGLRNPVTEGEVNLGLWLTLKNNCVLPIKVYVLPGTKGNEGLLLAAETVGEEIPVPPHGRVVRSNVRKPVGYRVSDMPRSREIMPGGQLLFSVPVTHVTREWHLRVEFYFITSSGPGGRQPRTFAEFRWIDLPLIVQGEIDRFINSHVQKRGKD